MRVGRLAKAVLTGSVGLLGLLTGFDNIVDYRTNLPVVQHVLSMDMLPHTSPLIWRALSAPLQQAAYALIIAVELLYGALCLFGALRLALGRSNETALAGLSLGFALYFFGFLVIAGEWFQMWQAGPWNMQQPAFRFAAIVGIVLVFVALPEEL